MKYRKLALTLFNLNDERPFIYNILYSIGDVYRELGFYDQAKEYYYKAYEDAKQGSYFYGIAYAQMQIGGMLHKQENKYEESNQLLLESYKYALNMKDEPMIFHSLGYIIDNFGCLGLQDSIIFYSKPYIEVSKGYDASLAQSYNKLLNNFKRAGNDELSQKYKRLADSLYNKMHEKQ